MVIFVWLLSFPLQTVFLAMIGKIKGLGIFFGIRAAFSASIDRGPFIEGFLALFVPLFVLILPFVFALYAAFPGSTSVHLGLFEINTWPLLSLSMIVLMVRGLSRVDGRLLSRPS